MGDIGLMTEDFFGSATNNGWKNGVRVKGEKTTFYGHDITYYRRSPAIVQTDNYGKLSHSNMTEMFANYWWARTSVDPTARVMYKMMQYAFPKTTQGFDDILVHTAKIIADKNDPDLPNLDKTATQAATCIA